MPTANSGSRAARHASNTSSKSSYKKRHNRRKEKTACFKNLSWLTYRWDGRFLAGVGLLVLCTTSPKIRR